MASMLNDDFSLFDLAPGRTLGPYRIERPHRSSGFASVLEAREEPSGARVELSVFPSAMFDGLAQAKSFASLLESWRQISSSHVLRVREVKLVGNGNVLVASDYPPGRTLRAWLEEHRRMDPLAVAELGQQLLDGAIEVHRQGLVHGDIKPSTIFVAERKGRGGLHAIMVDGGVTAGLWNAKHLGDRTALIGTPFYAPVEQFGGESPDVRSDVYNIATVMFELATGVLPWPGKSLLEVFQAKLDKRAPSMLQRAPGVKVPAELERVVLQGLMADRKDRYASAEQFKAALNSVPVA